MLRPFLLSLVLTGRRRERLGADQPTSDVSTWRWSVSTILDAQRASASSPAVTDGAQVADTFGQRYQRYSRAGLPEGSLRGAGRADRRHTRRSPAASIRRHLKLDAEAACVFAWRRADRGDCLRPARRRSSP